MPNKFHDDAFPAALSLSVCENVFEQQVSKFPFEMTQQRVGVGRRRTPIASHRKQLEGDARGMDVLRSFGLRGDSRQPPSMHYHAHPRRTHKNMRNCFFLRAQTMPPRLPRCEQNAHTISYGVYKKLSHFERKRCVFTAAAQPLSKFHRKCVPQGVFLCSLFFTSMSKHAEWSKIFWSNIVQVSNYGDRFSALIWSSSIHFGK